MARHTSNYEERFAQILSRTDPDILRLPHPERVRISGLLEIIETFLGDNGWRRMAYLMEQQCPSEEIINTLRDVPAFELLLRSSPGIPGTTNLGALDSFLPAATYRVSGSRLFQVTDHLVTLLDHTDIGGDTPVRYMKPPYPALFIEFGETRCSSVKLLNRQSGDHIFEGAYIFERQLTPGHFMVTEHPKRTAALGLDPHKDVRLLEITFTGSPVGKQGLLDDCTQHLQLFIQDEDLTVEELLQRHFAWYLAQDGGPAQWTLPTPGERQAYHDATESLAKILLYLHTQPVLERHQEASDLRRRLESLGPKKRARLERRLEHAYDRVLIRPTNAEPDTRATPSSSRALMTHWRRGHFRNQACGAGFSERKLIWIVPTLVAAGSMGTAPVKNYAID